MADLTTSSDIDAFMAAANKAAARTALDLGTAATTDATDYATAAQGSTADSALQSGDDLGTPIGGDLQNCDAFTGDTGTGGVAGIVPAPATGDATKFLKGDGTWDDAGGGSFDPASPGDIGGTTPGEGTFVTPFQVKDGSTVVFEHATDGLGGHLTVRTTGGGGTIDITGRGDTGQAMVKCNQLMALVGSRIVLYDTSFNPLGVFFSDGGSSGYLQMKQGTGAAADNDTAILFAKDVSGTAEMFVKDEAGNETQISPHNPTAPASFYDSAFDEVGFTHNEYTAICIYTNKSRMNAGRIDFLFIETYDEHNTRLSLTGSAMLVQKVWATVQAGLVAARDAERAAWTQRKTAWEADPAHEGVPFAETQPALIAAKPIPAWLTSQLSGRTAYLAARTSQDRADRIAMRATVGNAVSTLHQWATDARNTTATSGNAVAVLNTMLPRLATFFDRFADFIQAQRFDQ